MSANASGAIGLRSSLPTWPKFAHRFNASIRTANAKRRLRDPHAAPAQQDAAFSSLIQNLAQTSHWKLQGIESGMSYPRFQARVPLHTYADIAPAVEIMKQGANNVLWPGDCTLYGQTAGTSTGHSKCLPMTRELLAHFRRAGFEALLYYTARVGSSGVFTGRHLYHGSLAALTSLKDDPYRPHFIDPSAWVDGVPPSDVQRNAIASGIASGDVSLIAGLPNSVTSAASVLRDYIGAGESVTGLLQQQCPKLECFMHTGAALAPYAAELKRALGHRVELHEVYAASEGLMAVQEGEPGSGLRVMANMGLFFEFVSVTDFDNFRLEHLGPKAVPLAGVRATIDYVILLTTPGGLARYVLGDVVRFTSVTPPRLIHVGGTNLRLNAFGENVTERDVSQAIVALCQRCEWTLTDFHVAPYFAPTSMTGQQRGGHEWWVELKPGTVLTPTGPRIALELDARLRETCAGYAARRGTGMMDAPVVRLVMPGVFDHRLRFHQERGGQRKMPRCRSDRLVADEFMQMTHFAEG